MIKSECLQTHFATKVFNPLGLKTHPLKSDIITFKSHGKGFDCQRRKKGNKSILASPHHSFPKILPLLSDRKQ